MPDIYRSPQGASLVEDRYRALLKRWPAPNRQFHVPTRSGETFVIECGAEAAPPLLLLHGGATNSVIWMRDAFASAGHFRIYAVDLPGEPGLTAPVRLPLGSEAHAQWLDDVLAALGLDRVAIAGNSLGGWLALDYATRRPQRVAGLALLAPGGVGRQKLGIVFETLLLRLLGNWGRRKLKTRVLGRAPENPSPAVRAFTDFVALIHEHFRPRMVRLPVFSDEALRALTMPVLAIVGGRDVLLDSAETRRRLEQCVAGVKVRFLPEAGHAITGQTDAVLEFFAK